MGFEDYLRELGQASSKLKASDLARLSRLSDEQAGVLAVSWPDIEVNRRREIVDELLELQEDNVEFDFAAVFLTGLDDEDAEVRVASVQGLWEHEGPDIIARLLPLVTADEDPRVRAESGLALGRFVQLFVEGRLRERYFRDVEEGLRAVISNTNEIDEVRARALEAIGPHDDAWVRQAISGAYESGARRMKVAAVHAMGRSCELRWLPLLLRELGSEEPEVRYEAATAVGSLGDASVVPQLVPLLSDTDDEVRDASIAALGEIGGREARAALTDVAQDGPPPAKDAAMAALARIDFEEDPLSFRYRP